MQIPLSDADMKRYIPNVIKYQELSAITPQQLLSMLPVVILYQVQPDEGHWTLLHKTAEGIEFFDPYGFKPDKEFNFISASMQQPHYIADLLYKLADIKPIHYNQYAFQSEEPGINTCGRWVILRHKFSHIPLDVFYRAVTSLASELNLTGDQFVVKTI